MTYPGRFISWFCYPLSFPCLMYIRYGITQQTSNLLFNCCWTWNFWSSYSILLNTQLTGLGHLAQLWVLFWPAVCCSVPVLCQWQCWLCCCGSRFIIWSWVMIPPPSLFRMFPSWRYFVFSYISWVMTLSFEFCVADCPQSLAFRILGEAITTIMHFRIF